MQWILGAERGAARVGEVTGYRKHTSMQHSDTLSDASQMTSIAETNTFDRSMTIVDLAYMDCQIIYSLGLIDRH